MKNNNEKKNDTIHEQAGGEHALAHASEILLVMVLTSVIVITVLVDNSEAPWQVKMGCVGTALTGFIILAGWID